MGGYFATKVGSKRVLLIGVVVWTLFDLSTVVVHKCLGCLFLARIGMGLGEGILFPCMHQISGAWYPLQERSQLVTLVSSGSDLGTILALIVSPAILEAWGWQYIFLGFGVLSLLWAVAFASIGASHPEEDPRISFDERQFILANRTLDPVSHKRQKVTPETEPINLRVLLTSRPAWAIYVAHICYNYSWYILLGWIPQYFRQVLHIDLGKKGYQAALPYAVGYIGVLVYGRVADALVARDYRVLRVRQLMNGIGFFGSAIFLYSLRFATNATSAILLLSLTLLCGRASMAGYWVNMIDVGPNHAAHVMGVSNTFATIPGIVGNVITGKILAATGNWNIVFGIASFMLVFGGIFFHCNASDKSIYKQTVKGESIMSTTSSSDSSGVKSPPLTFEPFTGSFSGDETAALLDDNEA